MPTGKKSNKYANIRRAEARCFQKNDKSQRQQQQPQSTLISRKGQIEQLQKTSPCIPLI